VLIAGHGLVSRLEEIIMPVIEDCRIDPAVAPDGSGFQIGDLVKHIRDPRGGCDTVVAVEHSDKGWNDTYLKIERTGETRWGPAAEFRLVAIGGNVHPTVERLAKLRRKWRRRRIRHAVAAVVLSLAICGLAWLAVWGATL
jgi:hypothetical protein